MADGEESVVTGTQQVTLLDELGQVRGPPHLGQESANHLHLDVNTNQMTECPCLGSEHVRDLAEDGPAQLESVLHHQHLPLVLRRVQLLVRLLDHTEIEIVT